MSWDGLFLVCRLRAARIQSARDADDLTQAGQNSGQPVRAGLCAAGPFLAGQNWGHSKTASVNRAEASLAWMALFSLNQYGQNLSDWVRCAPTANGQHAGRKN